MTIDSPADPDTDGVLSLPQAAHDIRSHLNAITVSLGVIRLTTAGQDPQVGGMLDSIERQVGHLDRIADRFAPRSPRQDEVSERDSGTHS
jgi:hypothetical protein